MFLLILDKDPYQAAKLVPNRLKFKQLLELGQLICSTNISSIYKPIRQGKELQKWITENKFWTYKYFSYLWFWCVGNIKFKPKTMVDLYKIRSDLFDSIDKKTCRNPKSIIFRYKKGYESEYETNSLLPTNIGVNEYKKYIKWKEEHGTRYKKLS